MTDRPIPFSPPMVRALLDGRKTMTRRILKPPAPFVETDEGLDVLLATGQMRAPYAPGDRLWVKEAWRVWAGVDNLPPRDLRTDAIVIYEAGGSSEASEGYRRTSEWPASESSRPKNLGRYRHARFMPRWASRLTLIVTDVRLERLQDISEDDAIAEGMTQETADAVMSADELAVYASTHVLCPHARARILFNTYWDHLHGDGSWEANPFVAVCGFRPVLANIDVMEG